MSIFYYLSEAIIIIALVVIIFGGYFIRFFFRGHVVEQNHAYTPSVTVMMSCFNEGKSVYDAICAVWNSNYPADKLFVIAVDDCSTDDSWNWMQKAAEKNSNIIIYKNSKNIGKPKTLLGALSLAKTELILNIDSDVTLDPNAIRELASCMSNPNIGAVGGTLLARNSQENWLTQLQTLQYNSAFQMTRVNETFSKAVSCISGAMFMTRRAIYEELRSKIENRNWFGHQVKDGEDRFMTNLILNMGYKTILNIKATCRTEVPSNFTTYFAQQLRWRRGFIRMLLWSLRPTNFITRIKKTTPFSVFRFYISCILLLTIPSVFAWILITDGIFTLIYIKLYVTFLMTLVHGFNYFIAKANGVTIQLRPIAFITAAFWTVVDMTLISALAISTLTSTSWETRTKNL